MKHRLVLSLLLLGAQAQPTAACHHFRVWHFHTPQRCSYTRLARSIWHPLHHPKLLAAIEHPTKRNPAPLPPAPPTRDAVASPATERDRALEALREKMSGSPQ